MTTTECFSLWIAWDLTPLLFSKISINVVDNKIIINDLPLIMINQLFIATSYQEQYIDNK